MIGILILASSLAPPPFPPGEGGLSGRIRGAGPCVVHVVSQPDPGLRTLFPGRLPRARRWSAPTGPEGRFRVRVPPGQLYRIWAVSKDRSRVSAVRHGLSPTDRLSLPLMGASEVELRQGEPWRGGLSFLLLGWNRKTQREFPMYRGHLAGPGPLPPLPPGRFRLLARTRDGRSWQTSFRLDPRSRKSFEPRFLPPARLLLRGLEGDPSPRLVLPEAYRFLGEPPERLEGGAFPLPAFGHILRIQIVLEDRAWLDRDLGPIQPGRTYRLAHEAGKGRRIRFLLPEGGKGSPASLCLLWEGGGRVGRRFFELEGGREAIEVPGLPELPILVLYRGGEGGRDCRWIGAEGTSDLELRPRPGIPLELRILGPDPQAEVRVLLEARSLEGAGGLGSLHPPAVFHPDPRGRVRIPSLGRGTWRIFVQADRYIPVLREVRISGKTPPPPLELELELGWRIRGRVLSPEGKQAPSVLVTLSHPLSRHWPLPLEALSGPEGDFEFRGLPRLPYILEARREEGARTLLARKTRVEPGPGTHVLQLSKEDPPPLGRRRKEGGLR